MKRLMLAGIAVILVCAFCWMVCQKDKFLLVTAVGMALVSLSCLISMIRKPKVYRVK